MIAAPDKLLLRLNEAARALSISPSLLRRMAKAGNIPSVRMGCRVLFSRDSLAEYIKNREAEPYVAHESLRRI